MQEIVSTGKLPLHEKRVLVAASPQTAAKLSAGLESWGAKLVRFQATEIRRIRDAAAMARVLAALGKYRWIVFTSSYGVRFFMELLAEEGLSGKELERASICTVGPATAEAARGRGLRVDLVPEEYVAEGVLNALSQRAGASGTLAGCRILLPRAKGGRDIIRRELAAAGALVDVLPCYETLQAQTDPGVIQDLLDNPPNLLVFTSSSNVSSFVSILGRENGKRALKEAVVAVLGPVTAQTVADFGKRPEILPRENTVESLLQAIFAHFSR